MLAPERGSPSLSPVVSPGQDSSCRQTAVPSWEQSVCPGPGPLQEAGAGMDWPRSARGGTGGRRQEWRFRSVLVSQGRLQPPELFPRAGPEHSHFPSQGYPVSSQIFSASSVTVVVPVPLRQELLPVSPFSWAVFLWAARGAAEAAALTAASWEMRDKQKLLQKRKR